jgi:hypothetical protein
MKKLLVTPEGTFELDLTAEDIAQREQDAIQAEADKLVRLAKEEQEKARKESAIAKLKALGLTEEEANAIIGL